MDDNLLKSVLGRFSRHAFEAFVLELFNKDKALAGSHSLLPQIGEGVFSAPLIDSYGDSLHIVTVLHYLPFELFQLPETLQLVDDCLIARLRGIQQAYAGQVGYWGMVSPALERAPKLEGLRIVTNMFGIPRSKYTESLIPQYENAARQAGIEAKFWLGS